MGIPVNSTTSKNFRETAGAGLFQYYTSTTASSTEKIEAKLTVLLAKKLIWEFLEKALFWLLFLSQIINVSVSTKLQFLDHTKESCHCHGSEKETDEKK